MALTAAAVCDCGLPKARTDHGYLFCAHCDMTHCENDRHCERCDAYKRGIISRVILKAYNR